jgi:hypothetical protein
MMKWLEKHPRRDAIDTEVMIDQDNMPKILH